MAACANAPAWRNFFGDTCSTYASNHWCSDGLLVNTSTGGAVFGSPESACCACGRTRELKVLRKRHSNVKQAVFFATHTMDETDTALVRHYVDDLEQHFRAAKLFILYYQSAQSLPASSSHVGSWLRTAARSRSAMCVWNEAGLFSLFPRLEGALSNSSALAETPKPFRRYFFFHASLLLWNATYGHAFPGIEYWWRIEPDVLFAGSLSQMIEHASHVRVDLLLPNIESQSEIPDWPHWERNRDTIDGVPTNKRFMSLVCLGRYSSAFLLQTMGQRWATGVLGYEEISLSTSCAVDSSCQMESLWRRSKVKTAKHCLYRPVWECSRFLAARAAENQELWHPVKNRSCVVEWLTSRRRNNSVASTENTRKLPQ